MGSEPLPSHSVAVLVHLVQCTTRLCLTMVVKLLIYPVLCAAAPVCAQGSGGNRNIVSGSSASLFNPPGKQWSQGFTQEVGRKVEVLLWLPPTLPPPIRVLLPVLVPNWGSGAVSGLGTVAMDPSCKVPNPGAPCDSHSCISASSGGAAFSGCPAETLTDGPL